MQGVTHEDEELDIDTYMDMEASNTDIEAIQFLKSLTLWLGMWFGGLWPSLHRFMHVLRIPMIIYYILPSHMVAQSGKSNYRFVLAGAV